MLTKEKKDRYRLLGLCTDCGKPVEPGYAMCRKCIPKENERKKRYYIKNIEKRRKYNAQRYRKLIDLRFCPRCGCPLDEYSINLGVVHCQNCRERIPIEKTNLTGGRSWKSLKSKSR